MLCTLSKIEFIAIHKLVSAGYEVRWTFGCICTSVLRKNCCSILHEPLAHTTNNPKIAKDATCVLYLRSYQNLQHEKVGYFSTASTSCSVVLAFPHYWRNSVFVKVLRLLMLVRNSVMGMFFCWKKLIIVCSWRQFLVFAFLTFGRCLLLAILSGVLALLSGSLLWWALPDLAYDAINW